MAKEDGRVARDLSAISMKETTAKIKSKVMESLHGLVGTFTKANTEKTSVMDTVR